MKIKLVLSFCTVAYLGTSMAATSTDGRCQVFPAPRQGVTTLKIPEISRDADCSLKAIIQASLAHGKPDKGEFETTTAYNRRIGDALNAELVPGLRLSSPIAVALPINKYTLKYDADKEAFFPTTGAHDYDQVLAYVSAESDDQKSSVGSPSFQYVTVSEDIVESSYVGVTGLGVKFQIFKKEGDEWTLHLTSNATYDTARLPPPPPLRVAASDAPLVKQNLALVIVGEAGRPPIYESSSPFAIPSLSMPYDRHVRFHGLVLNPLRAYVVRLDNDAILATATYDRVGRGMFTTPTSPRRATR